MLRSDGIHIDHTVAPVRPYPPQGALHPHGSAVDVFGSIDVGQVRDRYDAQMRLDCSALDRCRPDDARGLEVSPGGLGQDQLIQSQIRNRSS